VATGHHQDGKRNGEAGHVNTSQRYLKFLTSNGTKKSAGLLAAEFRCFPFGDAVLGCFRVTEQETGLRNIRHRFNRLRLALRWTRRAVGMSWMTVALLFCESAYGLLPLWQLSAPLLENTQHLHR
jgi:hypothetical protein